MSNNLADLIQEENQLYDIRRQKLITSVNEVLDCKNDGNLNSMISQNTDEIKQLQENANAINSQVQQIQRQAQQMMKEVKGLKIRKENIQQIINTLSSFQELNNLKQQLPIAIQTIQLDKCIKLCSIFSEIQNVIIEEFCHQDFEYVSKLIRTDLVQLQKEQFELALKSNDLNMINLCTGLGRVLKLDQSLLKIKEILGKQLKQKLIMLENEALGKLPENITQLQSEYQYDFLKHFVKILESINIEDYAKGSEFYGDEGLYEVFQYLLHDISNTFLVGILKKMHNFYNLENSLKVVNQRPTSESYLGSIIQIKKFISDSQFQTLELYLDEIAAISNEFENFIAHLNTFLNRPLKVAFSQTLEEYLCKFFEYSQFQIQMQIYQLVTKSESLDHMWNFDKIEFEKLTTVKGRLIGDGHHEWLEEYFYTIKNSIIRSVNTQNEQISAAYINFISSQIIGEDLHQLVLQLFNRYLKIDYFNTKAICLTIDYTVHNSFIILMFNLISNIPVYIKALKQQLYHELDNKLSKKMIITSLEELLETNTRKFSVCMNEKIKLLAENLKSTIKPVFESIKSLKFNVSEVVITEQEKDYNKAFSQNLKTALKGLEQWKTQMLEDNYETLLSELAKSIARTLEIIIFHSQYNLIGSIIAEKQIRNIINHISGLSNNNLRSIFTRLQMICETLIQESYSDMLEFQNNIAIQEITLQDIKRISELRLDLKK